MITTPRVFVLIDADSGLAFLPCGGHLMLEEVRVELSLIDGAADAPMPSRATG
ncbi:hypothetical protein [Pseudomonas hormoni]